jgi:hypothetical protein
VKQESPGIRGFYLPAGDMALGIPTLQQIVIDPPVSMAGWWSGRVATGKHRQRSVYRPCTVAVMGNTRDCGVLQRIAHHCGGNPR